MIEKLKLKNQFIITFALVIGLSFILSIITFSVWQISFNLTHYPANYYEKQLPNIKKRLIQDNDKVLDPKYRETLEDIVPVEGIGYQVLDTKANIIYGNIDDAIIKNEKFLYENLNTNINLTTNLIANTLPIFNDQGDIIGVILFRYSLTTTPRETNNIAQYNLVNMLILAPFLYIIIFTMLFSKKFTKNINKPMDLLIEGAEKIRNRDLDFSIDYPINNEMGKLCNAFEDMRINLKESLLTQWKLEEERREMVDSIAHDLRTPLTIIKTYTETLLAENMDDSNKHKRYLEVIIKNNERAITLLDEMNKVSRVESPDFSLEPMAINISKFLREKEEEYKLMCNKRNIDFSVETLDKRDNHSTQFIDAYRLEQILDNIILNSMRYTSEYGKIHLSVDIQDNTIKFSISDNGKGFSPEDLSNVFKKFYKGDKSRSFTNGQAGLGLYICKVLVEKHGGYINAKNNIPMGACIEFEIDIVFDN